RDRLDGGRGSDTLFGMAGDDRLWGDGGQGIGRPSDVDTLFAGQGNDDLVGGQGRNRLYAWSFDPSAGEFGVFVDSDGELHDDSNNSEYTQEDTGLNRMLGSAGDDELYGGTGLDFLYGNGGEDQLYRADGRAFETLDEGLAGDEWKEYAKSTSRVWYVGASNADDVITVDFVTEPGPLGDHHLVTRLTNNDGNYTFAAQVQLDFRATDADGNPIWDASDILLELDTLRTEYPAERGESLANLQPREQALIDGLLPDEGDFLAIIIDALDGDDEITVGPTVQKTVWIDAGAGDDRVEILAGNAILVDQTEGGLRNDVADQAHALEGPAALVAGAAAPVDGRTSKDSQFTLTVDGGAPVEVSLTSSMTAQNLTRNDLIVDLNNALATAGIGSRVVARLVGDRIAVVTTSIGSAASIMLEATAGDPILDELHFGDGAQASGGEALGVSTAFTGLTIDSPTDVDWYRFALADVTGAILRLTSASEIDGLAMTLYSADGDTSLGELVPAGVNKDLADLDGENESLATAYELADIGNLSRVSGLTLHSEADLDYFRFSLLAEGTADDRITLRQTSPGPIVLEVLDAQGEVLAIVDTSADTTVSASLEGLEIGDYYLRVSLADSSDTGVARYELAPSIGETGFGSLDLSGRGAGAIDLSDLEPDTPYLLKVESPNLVPTIYDLTFSLGDTEAVDIDQSLASDAVRRDVIIGGLGNDILAGGPSEDWIFGGLGDDVLSGGLDRQASDLLFGGEGDDTFQLIPDALPLIKGTNKTLVPTTVDRFDGGAGDDRVLFLGGDYDALGEAVPDEVAIRYNRFLHRYEFTSLVWDTANQQFLMEEAPATLTAADRKS
ncbi:MAG: hypothetical protein ACF8NJ_06375, partial [Phycisphaerales bacterium JB038]